MKNESTPEQEDTLRDKIANVAETGAQHAANAAKTATGWVKVLLILLSIIAAGVAVFLQTSCEQVQNITPAQMQQAGTVVHELYHIARPGKPCVLVVPVDDVDK